ncbi:MAG TPA: DUF3667 domain-containing protein [Chitinophagaceae bacterium]|nr:DUF3667 domain-containing protein [Chitinophagaceae bacterium]
MHPTNCLNCATMLTADDRFCPTCGQKTDTHRITMSHIWHDVIHAFTHADKGFLYLLREMIFRPGHIAREYVEGKRKRYFNPFSYLLIVVAVSTFLISTFNLMTVAGRRDPISLFLNKHANLVIFLNVPIGAFFSWVFFKGRTYAENLVLQAYASGQRSAFYSLIIVPIMLSFPQYYMKIVMAYTGLWIIYLGWACRQFYQQRGVWAYIRGLLVGLLTYGVILALITAAYIIYRMYFMRR